MSQDSGPNTELEELKKAIESSDKAQKRRHTENIHIVFASAVVGSFFTQPFQNFISTQGLIYTTNIFASLSIIYVILKLTEITLRDTFQPYGTSLIFGLVTPSIYVISTFGYLLIVFSEIIGFSRSITPEIGILITIVLLTISIPYSLFRFKEHIDAWRYSIEESSSDAERFEKLLGQVPSIIEDGLTLSMEQPKIQTDDAHFRVDYVGEDAEGNTVLIEAKTGDISAERAQYTTNLINMVLKLGDYNIDRAIIAHTGAIQSDQKDLFEREGIEVVQVDPYSAYAIFGGLFKVIDGITGNGMGI